MMTEGSVGSCLLPSSGLKKIKNKKVKLRAVRVQNPLLGPIQYLSSWITFELEFHSAASCLFALKLNSVFIVD